MNRFTFERELNDFDRRSCSPETVSFRKIRIDSKGRISIPSDIRRSMGIGSGPDVMIGFDLEGGLIFLVRGQDGVAASIGDCGSPGPGSKLTVSETPGPDLKNNLTIETNKE